MAVHPHYHGLTVQITVDGQPLPEYDDEDAPADRETVAEYVEAKSGVEFAIEYALREPFPTDKDVGLDIYLDGKLLRSPVIWKEEVFERKTHSINGIQTRLGDKWVLNHLRFCDLAISEQENSNIEKNLMQKLKLLGMLKVNMEFGIIGNRRGAVKSRSFSTHITISENAVKGDAKPLQVGMGTQEEIIEPEGRYFECTNTFASFIFKYRTRANLEHLHVVPHAPEPTPASERNSAAILSKTDSLRLVSDPQGTIDNVALALQDPTPVSEERPRSSATACEESVVSVTPVSPQQCTFLSSNTSPDQKPRDLVPAREISVTVAQPTCPLSSPSPSSHCDKDGLDTNKITAMIKIYRGHDKELAGLNNKSLLGLLKHYEDKDAESTYIDHEPTAHESNSIHVKRELQDDINIRGRDKRGKMEIIVLDD